MSTTPTALAPAIAPRPITADADVVVVDVVALKPDPTLAWSRLGEAFTELYRVFFTGMFRWDAAGVGWYRVLPSFSEEDGSTFSS